MITLNRELLAKAAELPYVSSYDGGESADQDGFKFLGAGCERTVWLGPDGLVYKCDGPYRGRQNREEARQYRNLSAKVDLPCWVYLPETVHDAETGINVAEYIEGEEIEYCYWDDCVCTGTCIWEACSEAFDHVGSCDGHPGNCRVIFGDSPQDFIVAIIDFTR